MKIVYMAVDRLLPLHEVRTLAKVARLARSMRAEGWIDRPLLGHRRDDGMVQLWTGSHRVAAASLVGIDIPVAVIPSEALFAARESASWSLREDRPRDPETIYCDLEDWPEVVELLAQEPEPR